jgi:TonB family protein
MALPRFRVTERQVLLLLMGAIVVAMAGAIIASSLFTKRGQPLEPVTLAHIRWSRDPGNVRQLLADYFDPSLMSLPSPRGFSRGPWARLAPPAAGRYEPVIPPAFLPAPAGGAPPVLLAQRDLAEAVKAGLERPVAPVEVELPVEPRPAATNSVLVFEGALANRRLLPAPPPPVAPANLTARRSRLLIAVGADGGVRQAVVERSSGHEALDAASLEYVRQLRFEPQASVDPLGVEWGTVRWLWANAGGN